jgi:hypothetical protein
MPDEARLEQRHLQSVAREAESGIVMQTQVLGPDLDDVAVA